MNLEKSRKIKFLESAFGSGELDHSETNLHFDCPACNSKRKNKKKLAIVVDTGLFKCWVCNMSGRNISYLFMKYARNRLDECQVFYPSDFNVRYHDSQDVAPDAETVELPSDVKLIVSKSLNRDAKDVYAYLTQRGVTRADMYRWRISVSNDWKFRRKAIFPSFDVDGKLNFYVARSIDPTKFKYNNPKIHRQELIFNEIDVEWDQPVILVEGVFDAIKCPDNTIPILGSNISKKSVLFKKLSENKPVVFVAFDEDAAKKSHDACKRLHLAGCQVFRINVEKDDLGSMTKKQVENVLQTAYPWDFEDMLHFKIANIKSGSIL